MSTEPDPSVPDAGTVNEVRAWLLRVQEDLVMMARAVNEQPPVRSAAVFHAQQAAEKAPKAFLTWHNRPFRRTHDLEELTTGYIAVDAAFATLYSAAVLLTP